MKIIKVGENDVKKSFRYRLNYNAKFHWPCEIDHNVCFSDHKNHCTCKIDQFLDQSLSMCLAQGGKAGKSDGSKQKARLYYPVRLAANGHPLCVDEHPVESH